MDFDLDNRFDYHAPDAQKATDYEAIRRELKMAADFILHHTPPGREQSLAITKLEEAMFWSNAALARGDEGR